MEGVEPGGGNGGIEHSGGSFSSSGSAGSRHAEWNTYASFEKSLDLLRIEEHQLEKKAEEALSSMVNGVQFAAVLSIGSSVISQGKFNCTTGVSLSIMMAVPFVIGAGLAIALACNKIKRLGNMFDNLVTRQLKLEDCINNFATSVLPTVATEPTNTETQQQHTQPTNAETQQQQQPAESTDIESQTHQNSPTNVTRADVPQTAPTLSREDSFYASVRRLRDSMQNTVRVSNHNNFKWMLKWTAFGAFIHGIYFPIIAYFMLCRAGEKVPNLLQAT